MNPSHHNSDQYVTKINDYPFFCCSCFHRFFCSDAEDLLPKMKALVCLSAPVFLETTVGPANMIFYIAKDQGYGPAHLVFQKATYRPEAPNPQQTRA